MNEMVREGRETLLPALPPSDQTSAAAVTVPLLTPLQRVEVLRQLRAYLAEAYLFGAAYRRPTFRMVLRTFTVDEWPSYGRSLRRAVGSYADPTPTAAIAHLEGISIAVPEVELVPWEAIHALLESLPSHLLLAVQHALLPSGATTYGAAQALKVSQATVSRRCEEAIVALARWLYADRWEEP